MVKEEKFPASHAINGNEDACFFLRDIISSLNYCNFYYCIFVISDS
jgi:hypothetical protein